MDKKDGGTIDLESLQQVRDYFADRQDAEHRDGETFPTPNEEMRLLGTLDSVLAELTARRARDAEVEALVAAAKDMRSGWKYIRDTYGDLYGVGWDRAQDAVDAALSLQQESRNAD